MKKLISYNPKYKPGDIVHAVSFNVPVNPKDEWAKHYCRIYKVEVIKHRKDRDFLLVVRTRQTEMG